MMNTRPWVKDSSAIRSDSHQNDVFQEVKGHQPDASQPKSRNQPNQSKVQAESPIMGIQECSDFTGIAVGTLYKLTSQRKIPHSKPTKKVLFFKEEIIAWIAANRVEVE